MSVLVMNGEVQSVSVPEGIPVDQILNGYLEELIPKNQVICDVLVDYENADLTTRRWGDFERLEIHTDHPLALVKKGLSESGILLTEISAHTLKLAEHLRMRQDAEFRTLFVATIDDLLSFLKFLGLVQTFLGRKKAVIEQFQQNLKEQVDHLFRAQQQKDTVLLADLLEYEMVPLFEGWQGVRSALLKHIGQLMAAA